MTQFLPDNLLQLFAPRPPIQWLPPADVLSIDKKKLPITGVAEFVDQFETEAPPPKPILETREEKRARRRKEKEELLAYKIEQGIAMWNPAENPKATKDPYKTLFVARINYETSESKLKREFDQFGKIEKLIMVSDKSGKPRGYAFIEYSHKTEMSAAYKKADGTKIDGKRVVVDYERGRTVKSWLPRRLGGGKGDTRRARESKADMEARGDFASIDNGRSMSADRDRDRVIDRDRGADRDRDRRREEPRNGGDRRRSRSRERNGGDRGGAERGGGDRRRESDRRR